MSQHLQRHKYIGLLALVLLLAAAARFYGFTWGRPYALHVDESYVLSLVYRLARQWASEHSLNPHASSYGTLPLYLLLLVQQAARLIVALLGAAFGVDSVPLLYLGRLISALLGTATVGLIYDLGRRLYSRAAGLLGAGFLALAVLAVRECHFYTVDTMLVFWVTLAIWAGALVRQRGRWRDVLAYGVCMALAMSTKIVAALLVVPLLVAIMTSPVAGGMPSGPSEDCGLRNAEWGMENRPSITRHRRSPKQAVVYALLGLVLALLVWLVLNPYAVLDYGNYFNFDHNDDLLVQAAVVQGTLRPLYTLHFEGTPPYLYMITNWLPWSLGWPLEVLALAGLLYAMLRAVRGAQGDWLVLAWLLPYLLVAGSWYAKFIRYALPLVPLLCLLAGRLAVDMYRKAQGWPARAVVGLLATGVLAASLFYVLAYLHIYAYPDTRVQALRWIRQHVSPGATILVERDFALQLDKMETLYRIGDYRLTVLDHYNIAGVEGVLFQAPEVSAERKRHAIQSMLVTEFVILGDTWRERFLPLRGEYPAEAAFYEALFSGEAGYKLIAAFEAHPQLGPWTINDDTAEQSFRLFDHPRIYVFARATVAG
ncbi:MAG: glycosyltransferase family 39 protein [Anaerolineae bacterium]|nr:glycosyltransferase family 39 protein [Anaerolineae bacterium]